MGEYVKVFLLSLCLLFLEGGAHEVCLLFLEGGAQVGQERQDLVTLCSNLHLCLKVLNLCAEALEGQLQSMDLGENTAGANTLSLQSPKIFSNHAPAQEEVGITDCTVGKERYFDMVQICFFLARSFFPPSRLDKYSSSVFRNGSESSCRPALLDPFLVVPGGGVGALG